jgi:hypothetical protein
MDEPRVFVVRVWLLAGAFRATAREVHRDDTIVFEEPDALLRFLACVPGDPGGTQPFDPAQPGAPSR